MRKIGISALVLLTIIILISISCGPKTTSPAAPVQLVPNAPVLETWQVKWEKVISQARKEGSVVIFGTVSGETTTVLGEAFKAKYGIGAEFLGGRGAEVAQKILTERKAGIYSVDVYLGGTTSAVTMLKPAKVFDPLEPALILPEVSDPKMWVFGLDFVDKDRTIMPYLAYVVPPMAINTNLVKPEDLKSYRDLLQPKWKGKMVMQDPTSPGSAIVWFGVVSEFIMGVDYMRELAKQEPIIVRDRRLQVEWLAQGKYPIAIAPQSDILGNFQREVASIKKHTTQEGTFRSAGSGFVALMNQAPHPNASELFINWLLGREAQILYSKSNLLPSARLDVPRELSDPDNLIQPGVKYYEVDKEEFVRFDTKRWEIAREIFGNLIR